VASSTGIPLISTSSDKLKKSVSSNISTDGIDISDLQVPLDEENRINASLSVWDFAGNNTYTRCYKFIDSSYYFLGQELYYCTHQFFLSDQAIYLVVFVSCILNPFLRENSLTLYRIESDRWR